MRKTYTRSRTEGCYRPSSKVSVGLACVSRGWKKEGRHMLVFFFLFPKEFYLYFIVHNRSRSLTSWSRFKLWFLGWAFQLSWFKNLNVVIFGNLIICVKDMKKCSDAFFSVIKAYWACPTWYLNLELNLSQVYVEFMRV